MQKKSYVNVLFIGISISLTLFGAGFQGYNYWFNHQNKIRSSKSFLISGIYQTGPQKEAISTTKLAELLGLSVDHPTHILDFSESLAEKKLREFPLFKSVKIQKKKPSHILIDYTIREPLLVVKDYPDSVIDSEGVIFPYRQFFTQKLIPECHFGLIDEEHFEEKKKLCLEVYKIADAFLKPLAFKILRLDVSNAFLESYSKKEIILTIEQESSSLSFPYYLRMNTIEIEKQFSNFLVLSKELQKQQKLWTKLGQSKSPKPKVIDLRLDGMALID